MSTTAVRKTLFDATGGKQGGAEGEKLADEDGLSSSWQKKVINLCPSPESHVVDNFSDFRLKYANYFDSGIVPLVCPSLVRSLFPHLAFALIVNFDAALVRTTGILAQSLFVSKHTAEASQPFMHLIYKTFLHMKPPSLAIRCLVFPLHCTVVSGL